MNRKPLTNDEGEVRELNADDFAMAKPAKEVLPEIIDLQKRSRGRPKSDNPKIPLTIRFDPEIITFFKQTGKGWQTRINKVLSEYVDSHRS